MKGLLNNEQQNAIEALLGMEDVFLTGEAGTGKSYVLKIAIAEMEKEGNRVLVCAPTGLASAEIGGVTLHQAFGLPLGVPITEKKFKLMTRITDAVRKADVIVIDEISMVRLDQFDAILCTLAKIKKNMDGVLA